MPDLWPSEFGKPDVTPPLSILREQADLLTRKTRGVLEAEVYTTGHEDTFVHQFFVVAPFLDNYRYELFSVDHPMLFYPAHVNATAMSKQFQVDDEAKYLQALQTVLTSDETRRIIEALLAQSKAARAS